VEDGTPLAEQIAKREIPAPDDDVAADMYELTMDFWLRLGMSSTKFPAGRLLQSLNHGTIRHTGK